MSSQSYLTKTFTIADPDARLRRGDALDSFVVGTDGAPRTIANGTPVRVASVQALPAGVRSVRIFVEATDVTGNPIGWTSAGNLAGKFLSETIGELPPENSNRFGPNAAWRDGAFIGLITLVRVVGTQSEIEHIAQAVCEPFLGMVAAAAVAGRTLAINSAFRTYAEQRHLHDGFARKLPGFNPANRPGFSNHQNGIAFDFDVSPGDGNPNYEWMKAHATSHGFVRTVKSEAWHWEYRPAEAAAARARGVFGTFM